MLKLNFLFLIITYILIAKLKLSSNKLFWFVGVYLLYTTCFSQVTDYGLSFNGQGFKLDDRTQLSLTKNNSLNFKNNFELEFDVRFNQKKQVYGYIFRIINNENNIDFFSIPSRTFTRGITICIMISRYERQNGNSFSFLKQQLDRIESRPQFSLCIPIPVDGFKSFVSNNWI